MNDKDVDYPKILEIVGEFTDHRKQNLRMLQEYLARYEDIYQYVYSHAFPEIYTSSKKRGFDIKSNFYILFKSYQDKQLVQRHSNAKNLSNYDNIETSEYDQNPIKIFDGFNDKEENEIKKKAEKRLSDRRKIAKEKKAKKSKEKIEENKKKESEMLDCLDELNSKLNKIKTSKKEPIIIF